MFLYVAVLSGSCFHLAPSPKVNGNGAKWKEPEDSRNREEPGWLRAVCKLMQGNEGQPATEQQGSEIGSCASRYEQNRRRKRDNSSEDGSCTNNRKKSSPQIYQKKNHDRYQQVPLLRTKGRGKVKLSPYLTKPRRRMG
jgi:hypothetical protein